MQVLGKTNTKRLAWKKNKTGKWAQVEKTDTQSAASRTTWRNT
jgi:hypothetical protein